MITREIKVELKIELTEEEYIDMIRELDGMTLARYTVVLFDELGREKIDELRDFTNNSGSFLDWIESAKQFVARLELSKNGE